MWRPENWKDIVEYYLPPDEDSFEDGADAMLEALCNPENRFESYDEWCNQSGVVKAKNLKGWLVFVPDDTLNDMEVKQDGS